LAGFSLIIKPSHMSESKLLVKVLTLSVFVSLLAGFTIYRSGALDKFMGGKPMANAEDYKPEFTTDSPPSQNQQDIMSSSKSGVMFKQVPQVKAGDSVQPQRVVNNKPPFRSADNEPSGAIMYSSKSGPVFVPRHDTAVKKNTTPK
jgi:hypothetical protein